MDFKIRAWRDADAQIIARYANNANIAANLRDGFPYPYTLANADAFIESCREKENVQLSRCLEVNGEPVGSIGVFPLTDVYRKSAEIGYWLAQPFWGLSIMTGAVEEICRQAFERFDIIRIHAEVFGGNIASCRVLSKAGFVL